MKYVYFHAHGCASNESTEESYGICRGSGGVAILWRKGLPGISPLLEIKHDRFCGIRVQLTNNSTLKVYSVYMPAAGSNESLSQVLDELSGELEANDDEVHKLICGDFNGDMGHEGGPRGIRQPTRAGRHVGQFMGRHNCIAANLMRHAEGSIDTFVSHNGASTIDYVMVPEGYRRRVLSCKTECDNPLNTSDHLPIHVVLDINRIGGYVKCDTGQRVLRWDKMGPAELSEKYQVPLGNLLRGLDFDNHEQLNAEEEIDSLFDAVVNAVKEATREIPTSKFSRHLKPYWTDDLTRLKREKVRCHRLWKDGGRPGEYDDPLRVNMRESKKIFSKTLRALSKRYDNECVAEAAATAEFDRNKFWRLFKNRCGRKTDKVHAIKNSEEEVVYDVASILEVWRGHFSRLCTPKFEQEFDQEHYDNVTAQVEEWSLLDDLNPFLEEPFSLKEVECAIKKLHLKKAPGHDGVTAEHIRYGGPDLCRVLCELYNRCVEEEYIPCNFRRGVQIPLYKGKNTCPLNPDNYRGITLLSSFSKLFEMLIWQRIEEWWCRENIISELQGACRKGSSCVHTALTLQETIAEQCEGGNKVFVAYFDVSKAFDSVWIDGLFFQLYNMGIDGSLWRMLYKTYKGFTCCVRIGNRLSQPYQMLCGIHQGGFLSLVKYITFINSLLVQLKQSRLCCTVTGVQTTPQGYADDLATCTLTGHNMNRVLEIVERHGQMWRYSFNAGKSAIMVYGERGAEAANGRENRMFRLGDKRVKETQYYDHVGVKACLKWDTYVRTEEKIKKARKVLNMATCLGIKRGGLNMATCCLIYWTVVIPSLCFGCEIWILKQRDIDMLTDFHKYAAKRIQRLHPRALNASCYACLGWLHVTRLIMVKKMMFLRTIFMLRETIPARVVLLQKMEVIEREMLPVGNPCDSPIKDLLNTGHEMGLTEYIYGFARGRILSKAKWKQIVWDAAWQLETAEWNTVVVEKRASSILCRVVDGPAYSIWWQISDMDPTLVRPCEVMVKLLCKGSRLKDDEVRLRGSSFATRMCSLCDLGALEDAVHLIMQCPAQADIRELLYEQINDLQPPIEHQEYFYVMMGKYIQEWEFLDMLPIWMASCHHIGRMYYRALSRRAGIG